MQISQKEQSSDLVVVLAAKRDKDEVSGPELVIDLLENVMPVIRRVLYHKIPDELDERRSPVVVDPEDKTQTHRPTEVAVWVRVGPLCGAGGGPRRQLT